MNVFFLGIILIYTLVVGVDLSEHGKIRETRVHVGKSFVGSAVIISLAYFGIIAGF